MLSGKFTEATAYAQDALARHHAMNFEPFVLRGLEHLAAIYVQQGDATRALHLAGAAAARREARGEKLDPGYAAIHASTLTLARARLSAAAYTLAWEAGGQLALADAVAEALAAPARAA